MRKSIGILIHFDERKEPISSHKMAFYFDYIIKTITTQMTSFSESIEIHFADSFHGDEIRIVDTKIPLDFLNRVTQDTCFISVSCIDSKNKSIFGNMCVMRSSTLTQPMIGKEQTIYLTIDLRIWNKIQTTIFKYLVILCESTSISYIAIDGETVVPKSIYTANLRLFAASKESALIDVETKIPGIYWTQYIGKDMLSNDIIKSLLNQYSSKQCKMIEGKDSAGIWIQTTLLYKDDSEKHHKELYDLYKVASYKSEPDIVALYKRLQPWIFTKFPEE